MIVTDKKISEMTPKTLSRATLTGWGSLGSNSVCSVYSGLVPMSPKTTPSAPTANAPCAAARRLTPKGPPPASASWRHPSQPPGSKSGRHARGTLRHLDPVAGGRDALGVDREQHVVAGRDDVGVGRDGDVEGAVAGAGEVDRDGAGVDVGDVGGVVGPHQPQVLDVGGRGDLDLVGV